MFGVLTLAAAVMGTNAAGVSDNTDDITSVRENAATASAEREALKGRLERVEQRAQNTDNEILSRLDSISEGVNDVADRVIRIETQMEMQTPPQ